MKIHEYQAKTILAKYGVAVPRGEMALTRAEAEKAAHRLFEEGAKGVVVKAQIHAGGRGKGGGVKVAKNLEEAKSWSDKILGMRAGHAPDRPGRQDCAAAADRRDAAD